MAKRGRPSQADRSTVIEGSFGKRPDPPDSLTNRQAEVWLAVVAGEKVEVFNTATLRALLANLCRHTESAENLSKVIDEFNLDGLKNEDGAKQYQTLLRMRELETRAVLSIATKLRLTNQSRYTPQAAATAAKNAVVGPKPWEM